MSDNPNKFIEEMHGTSYYPVDCPPPSDTDKGLEFGINESGLHIKNKRLHIHMDKDEAIRLANFILKELEK